MIGHFPSLFTKYLVLEWHKCLENDDKILFRFLDYLRSTNFAHM